MSSAASFRPAAWPATAPPVAPREPHEIRQLGRVRTDAYAWMRFVPAAGTRTLDTLPPRLRAHLAAEMRYARDVLGPLEPAVRWFYERLAGGAPEVREPLSDSPAGWRYHAAVPEGGAHRVFARTGVDGRTQRLLDEAARAGGHAYYRATDHQPSPDDRYFAWAEDVVGDDRHRICVLDTESGALRTLVASDAFGYGGFAFSPSSRYLFWIWRDAHSRPARLYRSPVEGGEPVLVHEERDPAIFMRVARTAAGRFVALTLAGPDTGEVRLIAADAETEPPRPVRPRRRGVRYEVDEWNGALLMLTDADGAFDRKLLRLDPATLAVRDELVPHRPGVPVVAVRPFAEALARLERVDGLLRLVLMHPDGRETPIGFDEPACSLDLAASQPYGAKRVRIMRQTPASPPRWLDVDLASGRCEEAGRADPRGFDPAAYRVERLEARAPDGEMVPVTVLSRRDARGPQPLLLTGYGAYGIAREPDFSWPAAVLVDAGFRHAIAHVRGGSEKGARWYRDGCRGRKRNSMTDFIACARHLVEIGYAAPGRIVAHGVSAGGLLVCGAMNEAPELWAGVIAQVPFVDMLNTMSDAGHPLVPLLRPDWGDPLADPAAYDWIAAISPCENVGRAAYPPLLCTAGLKDDRVPYWEPAKLVANVRHRGTGGNPAILVLDPDSGHQGSDDRDRAFAQAALFWAYACRCAGVPVPPGGADRS
ncbi:S9 family peptidase [Castellaniella defragrans]|uniref:S9 family peptidase n=1 Tax=Castellaniella defragrans TaxID=75697 RepID=UPI0023F26644|nr:prolyl oligopeptidase family serine peptidase [Castellaniella defragrans]